MIAIDTIPETPPTENHLRPNAGTQSRSAKQLTLGPAEAAKTKPTLARLRNACDAFNVRGTRRLVAYELLTYWEPGGTVFPSIGTLADGLGLKARRVQHHLARLERVGLWVRHGRTGQTNTYELRLPGRAAAGGVVRNRRGVSSGTGGGCRQEHPEVTNEVTSTAGTDAAAVLRSTKALPPKADQQQQPPKKRDRERRRKQKLEGRIDGIVGACAARARTLGIPFDEPNERQRLAHGEIDVDGLQALADDLKGQLDEEREPDRRAGRVRNCPECHAYDREHDDRCAHCDWTRQAWEARRATR